MNLMNSSQNDKNFTIFLVVAVALIITVKCSSLVLFKIGQSQLKKGSHQAAYTCLKFAHRMEPSSKDYRYYYAKSMLNVPPSVDVQKDMFRIANGKIQDSASLVAAEKIANWKHDLSLGGNYIEQAPSNGGILRWNSFPLKVYIENSKKTPVPDYYHDEILRAFSQWQAAVEFIEFTQTNDKKEAQIIVDIQPIPQGLCPTKQSCKYVVGYASPQITLGRLKTMTIILYNTDPAGQYFSDKEIYNTILHEAGHTLGIMGHSYSSGDLMYMGGEKERAIYVPHRSAFQYLSSQDINTVKLLYKLIPDVTNVDKVDTTNLIYPPIVLGTSKDMVFRKIDEAENYIKKAPKLAGGYIDLGAALTDAGQYNKAIDAYQKAFSLTTTNEEKYVVLYNVAAIYMNAKKYQDAIEYAQKAQAIKDSEDIRELISNITHAQARKNYPNKIKELFRKKSD